MGPENDLPREIRALLADGGQMTTLRIAVELQQETGVVAQALLDMRGVEYLGGHVGNAQWRLVAETPNLDIPPAGQT